MGGILYVHRLAKILDETVRDLGLTVVLTDKTSSVDLSQNVEALKIVAQQLGIDMKVQPGPDFTTIQFQPK